MTTCNHALYAIVDVFSQYYDTLCSVVLPDLYEQLYWCVQQENEQLARSAINCLENLVISNGLKFSEVLWQQTIDLFLKIFDCTMPHTLLTWEPDMPVSSPQMHRPYRNANDQQQSSDLDMVDNADTDITQMASLDRTIGRPGAAHGAGGGGGQMSPGQKRLSLTNSSDAVFAALLIRCVVQLELVEAVNSIVFGPGTSRKDERHAIRTSSVSSPTDAMPATNGPVTSDAMRGLQQMEEQGMYCELTSRQLFALISCLMDSHRFAKRFNANQAQRTLLWKAGFKGRSKPNLIRQETLSVRCAVKILFRMYMDETRPREEQLQVKERLISACRESLEYYIQLQSEQHRQSWLYVVHVVLERLDAMSDEQFVALGGSLSLLLCRLIETNERPEIRSLLRKFLERSLLIGAVVGCDSS